MKFKIAIHSTTDKITNSSTVIYTYSDGSVKVFKELIDEMFKTLGIDKTCDEVFDVSLAVDMDGLEEFINERLEDGDDFIPELYRDDEKGSDALADLMQNIEKEKEEKPEWFKKLEDEYKERENYYGFTPETTLEVKAKESQYEALAKMLIKFLYSTSHEGTRDG